MKGLIDLMGEVFILLVYGGFMSYLFNYAWNCFMDSRKDDYDYDYDYE